MAVSAGQDEKFVWFSRGLFWLFLHPVKGILICIQKHLSFLCKSHLNRNPSRSKQLSRLNRKNTQLFSFIHSGSSFMKWNCGLPTSVFKNEPRYFHWKYLFWHEYASPFWILKSRKACNSLEQLVFIVMILLRIAISAFSLKRVAVHLYFTPHWHWEITMESPFFSHGVIVFRVFTWFSYVFLVDSAKEVPIFIFWRRIFFILLDSQTACG